MRVHYGETPRFGSLKEAAQRGRRDTARGGPWLDTFHMTRKEWEAYSTGLHRHSCPGTSNRRMREFVHDDFERRHPLA